MFFQSSQRVLLKHKYSDGTSKLQKVANKIERSTMTDQELLMEGTRTLDITSLLAEIGLVGSNTTLVTASQRLLYNMSR